MLQHRLPVESPESVPAGAAEAVRAHAQLFDIPAQAVIATTIDGRIVYWSNAAARLYGWAEREVLGRDILDVTPTVMTREVAAQIMDELRAGRVWNGHFKVRGRDGLEFRASVRDVPVRDGTGNLVGIVGVSSRAD